MALQYYINNLVWGCSIRKPMSYDKHKQERKHRYMAYAMIAFVILFIACCFVGCKNQQLPTLPTNTHRDSSDSIRTELRIDTIYQDRWHKEYQKGDTVYIHDSIDRWHNKFVYIHDSTDNSQTDTIYQKVEIEKKGSAFLRNSGIALWVLIGIFLVAVIIGIVLKFAK